VLIKITRKNYTWLQEDFSKMSAWAQVHNMLFGDTKFEVLKYRGGRSIWKECSYLAQDSMEIEEKKFGRDRGEQAEPPPLYTSPNSPSSPNRSPIQSSWLKRRRGSEK
jgi:hypothetical protein